MNTTHRILIAALLSALTPAALAFDCQILKAFPAEIDRPGKYCLDQSHDLALTGNDAAISILANDVELDLRGHSLRNPVFEGGTCNPEYVDEPTVGISVYESRNVKVHNGALRCFDTGVQITQELCGDCNQANRVESMRIQQSAFAGVFAQGDFSLYADNHIVDSGSRTDRDGRGIYAEGNGNTIRNNDIQFVRNDGAAIATSRANNTLVVENRIQNAKFGLLLYQGRNVRYRDNLTASVTVPYSGAGTDLGNND
jgi:hypothetical protein